MNSQSLSAYEIALFKKLYEEQTGDRFEKFIFHFEEQFKAIDFKNKSILEIVCGRGFLSLYIAIISPSSRIDALDESEGEGSETDIINKAKNNFDLFGVKNVKPIKCDIMRYESRGNYDIIISNNAIHHAYEHGLLKWDVRAKKKYIEIFQHVKSLQNLTEYYYCMNIQDFLYGGFYQIRNSTILNGLCIQQNVNG